MILPSDPQGFLIGQKLELNIEETKRVVEAVNELKGELSEIKRLLAAGQRQSRQGRRSTNGGPTPTPNPAGGPRGPRPRPVPSNANPPVPPQNPRPTPRRGAGGRFEGNNPNPVPPIADANAPVPAQSRLSALLLRLVNGLGFRLSPEEQARRAALKADRDREKDRKSLLAGLARSVGAIAQGGSAVDPLASAFKELGGLLKPVGSAIGGVAGGAAKLLGKTPIGRIAKLALAAGAAAFGIYEAGDGSSKEGGDNGKTWQERGLDAFNGGDKTPWQDKAKKAFGIKSVNGEGAISAEFESAGNAGAINPDPANQSTNYGIYQFNTKTGGLRAVLDRFNPAVVGNLASLTPETPEFDAAWRELNRTKPVEFAAEQHRAAKEAAFEPLLAGAQEAGFDLSDIGVRSALFSASQQHGKMGNLKIYAGTGGVSGLSAEEQLIRFYASRSAYVANLPKKAGKWSQQNVDHELARYAKELPRAIAASRAAKVAPVKTTQPSMPSTPTPVESAPVKAKTDNTQSSSVIQPLTQNLSDRSLAQIATGGIGQGNRNYWS